MPRSCDAVVLPHVLDWEGAGKSLALLAPAQPREFSFLPWGATHKHREGCPGFLQGIEKQRQDQRLPSPSSGSSWRWPHRRVPGRRDPDAWGTCPPLQQQSVCRPGPHRRVQTLLVVAGGIRTSWSSFLPGQEQHGGLGVVVSAPDGPLRTLMCLVA